MPLFLNPKFALALIFVLPLMGGAAVSSQTATAFVMGAWAGVILVGPPLFFVLWVLRIKTLGEVLAPLMRLPILIALTVAAIHFSGVDIGIGPYFAGAAGALWWVKQRMFGLFV